MKEVFFQTYKDLALCIEIIKKGAIHSHSEELCSQLLYDAAKFYIEEFEDKKINSKKITIMERKNLKEAIDEQVKEGAPQVECRIITTSQAKLPQMLPAGYAQGMTASQYRRHQRTRARKGRK